MLAADECFPGHLIQAAFVIQVLINNLAFEVLKFCKLTCQRIKTQIQSGLNFQTIPDIEIEIIEVSLFVCPYMGIVFPEGFKKFFFCDDMITVSNQGLAEKNLRKQEKEKGQYCVLHISERWPFSV